MGAADPCRASLHTPRCAPLPQEQVEPMLMKYQPPGLIKKIYFQKLTLGDDPFR